MPAVRSWGGANVAMEVQLLTIDIVEKMDFADTQTEKNERNRPRHQEELANTRGEENRPDPTRIM